MNSQHIPIIVLAAIFLPFLWFVWRGIRKHQRSEKPFVDSETARAFDRMLSAPLRPEDVPLVVTRRLGPLPPAAPQSRLADVSPSHGDDSSALVSGLVGYHANSTLLGTLAGGNPIAAAIGDALRPDEAPKKAAECARPAADADPDPEPAADTADADTDSGTDSCSSTD